jgi:outer membrane protein assembly factor BamB
MSGATNASKSAYSRLTRLYYVPALERSGVYFFGEERPEPRTDEQFWGGAVEPVRDAPHYTALRAIDPATAKVRWEHRRPLRYVFSGSMGGILATAGDLVFGSDTSKFFALDADTGELLMSVDTGGKISAAPVSYRVDGRQYIALAAGDVLLAFGLPESAQKRSP